MFPSSNGYAFFYAKYHIAAPGVEFTTTRLETVAQLMHGMQQKLGQKIKL